MHEIYVPRLREELLKDEARKERERFDYASDIIAQNCIVPFSIWVEPNFSVRKVIDGVDYGSLPYDETNEAEKRMFWKEQAEFVAKHGGQIMLCEALEEEPCLQTECPLFVPAGTTNPKYNHPLCREYKIVFAKNPNSPGNTP